MNITNITIEHEEIKNYDNYGDNKTPNYSKVVELQLQLDLSCEGVTCAYIAFECLNGQIQDIKLQCDIFLDFMNYSKLIMFAYEYAEKLA